MKSVMVLEIPARSFDGYIFDCDGTIADSMPIHFIAWTKAVKEMGGEIPEDLFYQWGGKPTAVIVENLNEQFGYTMDVAETVHRKESYYLEQIAAVQPIKPVLDIAKSMHGVKPMAIASGGHRLLVEATLNALGILEMFDAIVCSEDYSRGKPFPDPFLEAARRIQVEASACVVFEDSPTGITAAKAAGMDYVWVPSAEMHRSHQAS